MCRFRTVTEMFRCLQLRKLQASYSITSYCFTTNTDTGWLCIISLPPSCNFAVTKYVLVGTIALSHCRTDVNSRNEHCGVFWPLLVTST